MKNHAPTRASCVTIDKIFRHERIELILQKLQQPRTLHREGNYVLMSENNRPLSSPTRIEI
uniref:Uncharacterized protein n=1 Tax=Romanomermis culicivorax TaxID=13658 RepID=A0A915I9P7_ROMCU